MKPVTETSRVHPAWWTLMLLAFIAVVVAATTAFYSGDFSSDITVWLRSDRAGLVMDPGGKVKMRGVQVGRVVAVVGDHNAARLKLELFSDQIGNIPANSEARIRASTAFGAKYVEIIYPSHPSRQRIAPGAQLESLNVSTEVQTVFQNLVNVLKKIEPQKLNAVLTALAEGVRGRGDALGTAITDGNDVLAELNSRSGALRKDWVSLQGFGEAYSAAAQNILTVLDASTVTGATLTRQAKDLDALLLNAVGLGRSGVALLGPSHDNFVRAINTLESTAALLDKYSPSYTCLLVGTKFFGDTVAKGLAADGRSAVLDATIGWGADQYRYPDNLPIIGAKGGPGGKPGCGSLPYVEKNWPQRYLVTNTGFGTGLDRRPNPGIAHPWWINFFPTTRGTPEPPSMHGANKPPAIGPVPYPGAPPYGAPLYASDGTPLYPGVPPAPPATVAPPPAGDAGPPAAGAATPPRDNDQER